jgi:hypothetical protein
MIEWPLAPPGMVLDTLPRPSDSDNLDHYFCCNPNIAMCGRDLTGFEYVPEGEISKNLCVVCADLGSHACGCACGCCPVGRQES